MKCQKENAEKFAAHKVCAVIYEESYNNPAHPDSPIFRVQIAWDGKWEDGDQEMKRHLIIKALNNPKA